MEIQHYHLIPSQLTSLKTEAGRQADFHHGRSCPPNHQWSGGSLGCQLWAELEAWAGGPAEVLILTKKISTNEISLLLRAVNNANNSITP